MQQAKITTSQKLAAIDEHLAALGQQTADLRTQIAELDAAGVCTGVEYWRGDKLYCNHNANQACLLHGKPEKDKRIRTYVGVNPDKQAQAQKAMERQKQKDNLNEQIGQLDRRRRQIEQTITEAWHIATGHRRWEM